MDASPLGELPVLDEGARAAVVAALGALNAKLASEGPITCVGPLLAMGIFVASVIGGIAVVAISRFHDLALTIFGFGLPVLGFALVLFTIERTPSNATGYSALAVVSEFVRTTSVPRGWRFEAADEDFVSRGRRGEIHCKRFFLVLLNDSGEQRSTSGLCVRPNGPTPTLNAFHDAMVRATAHENARVVESRDPAGPGPTFAYSQSPAPAAPERVASPMPPQQGRPALAPRAPPPPVVLPVSSEDDPSPVEDVFSTPIVLRPVTGGWPAKTAPDSSAKCPICADAKRDMALSPCGHLVCAACGSHPSIERCPICRTRLDAKIRLFF